MVHINSDAHERVHKGHLAYKLQEEGGRKPCERDKMRVDALNRRSAFRSWMKVENPFLSERERVWDVALF